MFAGICDKDLYSIEGFVVHFIVYVHTCMYSTNSVIHHSLVGQCFMEHIHKYTTSQIPLFAMHKSGKVLYVRNKDVVFASCECTVSIFAYFVPFSLLILRCLYNRSLRFRLLH